jgi:hypothetical protein
MRFSFLFNWKCKVRVPVTTRRQYRGLALKPHFLITSTLFLQWQCNLYKLYEDHSYWPRL